LILKRKYPFNRGMWIGIRKEHSPLEGPLTSALIMGEKGNWGKKSNCTVVTHRRFR
jgi:hypothetical protein